MVADAVVVLRTPLFTTIMRVITMFGSVIMLAVLTAVLVTWLVARGQKACALFVALSMTLGSGAIVYGVKHVVDRVRPVDALIDIPGTSSLPSGHAFGSLLFVGLVMVVTARSDGAVDRRPWMWTLPVIAVLVGLSRVYLGVHWASDVVTSWALAGIWLGASTAVFRVWRGRFPESRERRRMTGVER